MDEKIEKILQESTFKFTPEKYKVAVEDAKSMDTRSWIEKYQPEFEKDKQLAVAWKAAGLDKYSKDKWERYRESFGSSDAKNPFDRSENWLRATWQNDFSDIPYEQYRKDIETSKQYWEDEKRAREYEAGKKLREREVKDWPLWKNIIASDYAKQRYINEPEKSLFNGDNTLDLGLFKLTKWGESPLKNVEGTLLNKGDDISDISYGVAGAAGDVLPGYGTFVGPAVRAARDVQHKVTESPYQKEWSDIGQDALSDAAINFGVEYMPTAILNRGRKAGKNISKSDEVFSDYAAEMNFAQRQQANDAAFEYLNKNLDMFADARVAQIRVNSMPESDIKNDMLKLVHSDKYSMREVERYMDAYRKANENGIDAYKRVKNSNVRPNKNIKTDHLGENTIDFFKSKERLMGLPESKLRTGAAKISTKYAPAGQTVVKEIDTAKGRGSQPEVDTKLVKDWYKQNYERDWKMGFKPNEKEGDLLWEAYKEWTEGK